MPGLSKSAKKAVMRSLSSRQLQTSDYWEYAVSRSWLELWDDCISRSLSLESVEDTTDGCANPVTMSRDDQENIYIPESQWKIYVALFGVDKNHELRRRPIYTMYMMVEPERNPILGEHVIADKELDFLELRVGFLNDVATGNDARLKCVKVFVWDYIAYIGKQTRAVLGVKGSSMTRIWLCILPNQLSRQSESIVFDPIIDETRSLVSILVELTPNLKHLMKRRSTEMNPKYGLPGVGQNIGIRMPLWEDTAQLFDGRSFNYALAVEETGVHMQRKERFDFGGDLEGGQNESIVMISSIQNEWEDVLTTYVDKYTEDMALNTEVLREKLLSSAKEIVDEKLTEISEIRADFEKRFTLLDARERDVQEKENENKEKENEIADKLSKYKRGLEDFQRQKKKFADDVERIQAQNKITEGRVTLNIGGILYTTSFATLMKDEGSLLALMFSGKHPIHREPDGTYFIDRDGVNFRYILNYLRDGADTVNALPREEKLLRELQIEARFYSLAELDKLLQNKLQY